MKFRVIIWFFLVVATLITYHFILAEKTPDAVKEASREITLARLAIQRENLRRNDALVFYGEISALSVTLLCALMVSRAYQKKLSIHILELRGAKIPMREKDLSKALPVVYDLALAEKMEQAYPEKAFALYEKLTEMRLKEINALTSRGRIETQTALSEQEAIDIPARVPTFAELQARGEFQRGGDLICGFSPQGEAQKRSMQDIKALAITGWQGSGKTLSMAYLTACTLLQCEGSRAIIIDPHKNHDEGLGSILRPFEKIGMAEIIRGAAISGAIERLDKILDDRLEGRESSRNRIVLVIDEMARLSKLPCFDTLLAFIERCTNEIRKANILFIGGSTKWTARHFKGRADIRGVMPSSLVHSTKVSQARLIIEDMGKDEKAMFKQVNKPGAALLQTSSQRDPSLVTMPLITPTDILHVAELLQVANDNYVESENNLHVDDKQKKQTQDVVSCRVSDVVSGIETQKHTECLNDETQPENTCTHAHTWLEDFMEKNAISRKEIADACKVSLALVDFWKSGKRELTTERKQQIEKYFSGQNEASNVIQISKKVR